MPAPTPDEFWTLLAEANLTDRGGLDKLRREFEGLPFPPGASAATATELIARWLVKRTVITEWQARRLVRGEKGPFFLGEYRLLDRFETGRGGSVFRARHEPSGRLVGVTALNNKWCQQAEVWSDILKRTKVAKQASNPVLTRTNSLEKSGSQRFILSEDTVGLPLAEELASRGPLPVTEAGSIVLAVACAVAELHRLGVVHGGVSLDTVRRESPPAAAKDQSGPIRLLQFPLVTDPHLVPLRFQCDAPDAVARLGTRASFVPPEWLSAGRTCDTTGDVYAIGCLFHALLTGAPPCWQGDPQKTLAHVASGNGPAKLGLPRVPAEVATLVSYLTARDPAERYPTAAEAALAIAACLGIEPELAGLPEQQPMLTPGSGPGEASGSIACESALGGLPRIDSSSPPSASSGSTTSRRGAVSAARPAWLWPAVAGLGLLTTAIGGGVLVLSNTAGKGGGTVPVTATSGSSLPGGGSPEPAPPGAAPPANGSPADTRQRTGAGVPATAVVVDRIVDTDSPDIPFQPPQPPGPPPELHYLPPGSQLVLLARPAAALATAEGKLFARSLGPRAAAALEAAAQLAGCPPEEIAEIQSGWQAGGPDEVIGGTLIRGVERLIVATDRTARQRAWGPTEEVDCEGEIIHRLATVALWLPTDADDKALFVGPEELVRQTIIAHRQAGGAGSAAGVEASLPRDLEMLVGMLDSTRHITLLGSPNYLLYDGRPVLAGPLAKLVEPLSWFLGDSLRAAALSMHFEQNCYLELDAIAPADTPPKQLAQKLSANVAALAEAAEDYCNALDPHPYGRKLVMRLPRMLGVVADHIHAGTEGRGVVVNAWLPEHAAHNLALATELALEQTPRAASEQVATTGSSAKGGPKPPSGALDRLAQPISLVFGKDTLEKSIQMISDEIGVEMEIIGPDLQLEGITKNQSFGLDQKNKPAVEILRAILAKANPDGKLVYVVRTTDGAEKIEITTRAAVEKRGDTIAPGQNPPAPPDESAEK